MQQAAEGFVWVGVGRQDSGLTHAAAGVYLFFALAFWLFWIPFSAIPLATGSRTRGWLWALAIVGFAAGAGFYSSFVLEPEALAVSSHTEWTILRPRCSGCRITCS